MVRGASARNAALEPRGKRSSGPGEIRVLIVEDHPWTLLGIRTLLVGEAGIEIVGETGSAAEACRLADEGRPSVILLDLGLRDENGFAVAQWVMKRFATTILVISASNDRPLLRRAWDLGLHGYIDKWTPSGSLIDVVRAVAAGGKVYPPDFLDDMSRQQARRTWRQPNGQAGKLTERQLDVIRLVRNGRTNKEIADLCQICVRSVESRLTTIYTTTGVRNRAELAAIAGRFLDVAAE